MGQFSSVIERQNGQEIQYYWFNALRNAGIVVENFLGGGYLIEAVQTVENGATDQDVTGLAFNSATIKAASIFAYIRRAADSFEYISVGQINIYYRESDSTWQLIDGLSGEYDDGVEFSITTGGQVRYTSTSEDNSNYVGTMRFKAHTLGA